MKIIIYLIIKLVFFGVQIALFVTIATFGAPLFGIFSPVAAAIALLITAYPLAVLFVLTAEAILKFLYNDWN